MDTSPAKRKKIEELLWHYTTQEGLIGIVNSGKFWATNIFYLNDSTEYIYAVKLICNVINEFLKDNQFSDSSIRDNGRIAILLMEPPMPAKSMMPFKVDLPLSKYIFLLQLKDIFEGLLNGKRQYNQIYVQSFSAKKDDLSQWRGYCPQGNGFCIGFRKIMLSSDKENIILNECVYDSDTQKEMVSTDINLQLENIDLKFDELEYKHILDDFMISFFGSLLPKIPQMKDISFKEEKEWRAVYTPRESDAKPIEHRAGNSMIIPYVERGLNLSYAIKEVIVGPTPHPELSKKSTESFLKSKGITCKVTSSTVPYRML
jgi:hypothetical protein